MVLPVLNGEAYIAEQLGALAAQTYAGPWEMVVVDNGCTERTISVVESWAWAGARPAHRRCPSATRF